MIDKKSKAKFTSSSLKRIKLAQYALITNQSWTDFNHSLATLEWIVRKI